MALGNHELIIFDGACGTNLQLLDLADSAWDGREGCNEILNLTVPDSIRELHERFFDAGAMVVETNTFGATRIVLSEYGLEDRVAEINEAAVKHARGAADHSSGRYVAGSVGPGTKLVSLGHIGVDELVSAYDEQVSVLLGSGVDVLIVETCQDLLQVKLVVVTCLEVMARLGIEVPLLASLTIERTGTMLVGTDIAAAATTLEPFPLFSLGLNCATGPEDMESHLRYLHHHWPRRISCIPNQGLPEVVNGKTCYRLDPSTYARRMRHLVETFGVSIVGGCCGTTPEHIAALVSELDGIKPPVREVSR